MSEVVSEETHRLQFSHHIIEQVLLKNAVLSRYDHVHIAALLFSPAVGTAHLNVVHIDWRDHSLNYVLHEVEHARHFLPRDFLLELFEVFEADLLVSVEQVRSFAHVFDALDSHAVKLVCFGRTNAPNFAHVAPRHVLFFALQGLQLVYFSSLQQFLDFICDFVSDSSQILHVFFGLYLSIESPDDGCSLHVRHPPSFIALSSINLHQFRKLVRDVCIHWKGSLFLMHHQLLNVHLLWSLAASWTRMLSLMLVGVLILWKLDSHLRAILLFIHLLLFFRALCMRHFLGLRLKLLHVDK